MKHYRYRECRLPDIVKLNQIRPVDYKEPRPWIPVYFSPLHNKRLEYKRDEARSTECPISRLSQKTITEVNDIARAEFLRATMVSHGAGGGAGSISLFGPDLSKWPSWTVEAMELFMQESTLLDRRFNELDHPKTEEG